MDLGGLIQRLDTTFRRQAKEKGLDLSFELDPELHDSLVSDPLRLEQILKNFISNSIKFTEKGRIGVHFHRPIPETVFSRQELTPENSIAVSVTDTGIGIPAEHHQQVFEAFQQIDGTTSRRFGGTGLGLSISRELANILGGEIQLLSQKNEGSTFTLFLPLEPIESAAGIPVPEPENNLPSRTGGGVIPEETPPGSSIPAVPRIKDDQESIQPGDLVILVIEDDPNFAGIIFRFSHEKGFKCLHAGDGETGLKLVEKFMPDAVILDINLPGMNGYTVLDRLKDNDKTRNIPVHVMSAYDQDVEALNQRTVGYLKKPVLRKDLDKAFARISTKLSKRMRRLLLIEDDVDQSLAIQKVIDRDDLDITVAAAGSDALEFLKTENFDGVVLDLNLPDMSGHELLTKLKEENMRIPPVVIYTAEEISREAEEDLREFTPSIILKGAMSMARLKDETALFLHRVVKDLPLEKQERISRRPNVDEKFADHSILLVDDDMRNVFAIGKILSDSGMKVHKAADGKKALEILAKVPDIDLVLMDIMMPVMDGYTAMKNIRKLKNNYSEITIIALTAKAMPEDRNKCLSAGANDYLTKPIDIDLLFSMIHKYLGKQAEDKEDKGVNHG